MRVRPPTFDETPIVTATLDDLDLDAVDTHLTAARESGRYKGDAADGRTFLLEQRAAVEIESTMIPTVAGCLFFGRQPQHVFPYATIKLAHYRGDTISSEDVRHIDDTAATSARRLTGPWTTRQSHRAGLRAGAGRTTPRATAVSADGDSRTDRQRRRPSRLHHFGIVDPHRHAALAHRVGQSREPPQWRHDGEYSGYAAGADPALTMLLYQSGYVEAYGQGIDTVFNVLAAQDLPLPEMREAGATFVIAVTGHQMLLGDDERLAALTDIELQIVTLIRDRRAVSAQDLFAALAPRSDRSVQYDLKRLVERGILERAGRGRATTYSLAPR